MGGRVSPLLAAFSPNRFNLAHVVKPHMKFATIVLLLMLSPVLSFAQALETRTDDTTKPDDRPAQALYEDANGYLGKRYQEFNKKNLPTIPGSKPKRKRTTGTGSQKRRHIESAASTDE